MKLPFFGEEADHCACDGDRGEIPKRNRPPPRPS